MGFTYQGRTEVTEDDIKKMEALIERLDIELNALKVLGDKTEQLLAQVQEIEQTVKEMYK